MTTNDQRAARARTEANRFSRTNRPINPDAEVLGIAGERAFAILMGIPSFTPATKAPTRGYQFRDPEFGWKVKVTTSRTPGTLFVKAGKVEADVYILAGCDGDPVTENVYFVGWANCDMVKAAPIITPSRKGNYLQPAHAIKRADLWDMEFWCDLTRVPRTRLHQFPAKRQAPENDATPGKLF